MDFPLQEGQIIGQGRYQIDRYIGMGSYGLAYLATDLMTLAPCLVKQSRPSKKKKGIELLGREAEFLKQLDHGRIPRMQAVFTEGKHRYLVMSYIEGHNIEQLLFDHDKSFSQAEAILFIRELGELIHAVHQATMVHLDVRIPNVLIKNGELFLIDFGLARRYVPEERDRALRERLERNGSPSSKDLRKEPQPLYREDSSFKREMRAPLFSSDWFAVGHMLLFLLYSDYHEEEQQEERPWEEELVLHPKVAELLRLLLARESEEDAMYMQAIEQACEELGVGELTFKQVIENAILLPLVYKK